MIIGHEKIIGDLCAFADRGVLGQSWIFFGPKGVGKATVARALARHLETGVFEDEGRPLSDMLVVAPEEGSSAIGIDQARAIRAFLSETVSHSSRRTAIIEAGELLTPEAENALLKIAEEPPAAALLIIVVDDPERLLPTIRSRFAKLSFGAVPKAAIVPWLVAEGVDAPSARDAAERSFGAPGFARRIVRDERFAGYRTAIERLGALPASSRKAFVKELTDDEAFSAEDFLEALMFTLAWASDRKPALWHRVAELRGAMSSYNLNPRLHLTALAQYL